MAPRKRPTTIQRRLDTEHSTTLHEVHDTMTMQDDVTSTGTVINFSGVKTTFEPIPKGEYESEIVDYTMGVVKGEDAKNKGAKRMNVQFRVVEEGEWYNRRFFNGFTLVQDSYWAIKGTAIALGGDPAVWDGPVNVEAAFTEFVAQKARCMTRLDIREASGEYAAQNTVKSVKPLSAEQVLSGVR